MEPLFEAKAKVLFDRIGITKKYLGYNYTIYGLELITSDPTYLYAITKRLYVDIAKEFNCSPASVEKNIRSVVSIAFEKGSKETLKTVFKDDFDPPSNQLFFTSLYYYLEYGI